MFMKKICAALTAVCSLSLCACLPAPGWYPRVTTPSGASHWWDGNWGRPGTENLIYYPFHDIHISLNSGWLALGLHIPPGVTVEINDPTITVQAKSKRGEYKETFQLRAAEHPSFLQPPAPFYPETQIGSYGFGPLNGDPERRHNIWYRFSAVNPADPKREFVLPSSLLNGTITVPSLTINGVRYESQTLSFEKSFFCCFIFII